MILGFVRPDPAPAPAWFSDLGLESAGETGARSVHLGAGGDASRYRGGGLTAIAESVDATAVADGYRRLGPACVQHLPGRFRFIVHDMASGQLFAASSTAPPWPLAYWSDSRTTIVSSRLLPMLRCPAVPRALDESYLVHLVMGLSAMRDGSTAIRSIRRLCPGEVLVADTSGVRVSRVDRLTPRDGDGNAAKLGRVF